MKKQIIWLMILTILIGLGLGTVVVIQNEKLEFASAQLMPKSCTK